MAYNKEELKNSKTFCMAPWMSIHHWPDGKTYPCCLWNSRDPIGNLNDSSLKEIWNNETMKKTRQGMLKDEKISSCDRCYHLEDTGDGSYRQRINKEHWDKIDYVNETKEDGHLDNMNLHLWDLRISNFCNFKCRSCGHALSSSWHKDAIALGEADPNAKALISISDKSKFLQDIEPHYNCVDEIYFAGGEPLVMPEHYQILDRLIELGRTDVRIRYSTNFSKLTFKGKHIFDYWKQFPNLELYISIDGVGKVGELVRKGYDDELFYKNVQLYKESGVAHTDYAYAVTYGALNYNHLFDMVLDFFERDIIDQNVTKTSRKIFFSPIDYPTHYDSVFLPDSFKNKFIQRFEGFDKEILSKFPKVHNHVLEDIMRKLKTVYDRSITKQFNFEEMAKCKSVTDKLDLLRDEKFKHVFGFDSTEFVINQTKVI